MTTVIDSRVWGDIFSHPEIQKIWSDEQRTSYYLRFEAALAKVQAELGVIPQRAAEEIIKHCTTEIIDWDELKQKTELIGYPVLPVVQQLVKRVNEVEPGLGEWSHWGATTQDVTDTATVLQLRDTLVPIERDLDAIIDVLATLSKTHRSTPMAGRSHLQQAVPITFGFKMARLLATFQRHKHRLAELKPRLLVLEFGGAAGTLATLSPDYSHDVRLAHAPSNAPLALRCQSLLANELSLAPPPIAWHTERDNLAEFSTFTALLTATCAKFATDLKLMMQTEVGEAREAYLPHRGSSSTMPQKRNPIGCAYVCAMASSVRALAGSMLEAVVADHERSTGPWELEWVVLPQVCALGVGCLAKTRELLEGVEVEEERMRAGLGVTKGAVVSEAVMMGLGGTLGRQRAHDLVYELCRVATVEGRELVDVLKGSEEIRGSGLGDAELERLCDPQQHLGECEFMVDRVLTDVGKE